MTSPTLGRPIYRALQAADEPLCWVVIHDFVAARLRRANREPQTGDGFCICWSRGNAETVAAALNARKEAARKRRQRRLSL